MNRVAISVITATLNSESTIRTLISSLVAQQDRDFEWIVADGGSTDGTLDAVRAAESLSPRISSVRDFGIYDALNRALEMARTDYYVVVGADDVLYPNAVREFRRAAETSNADIIAANFDAGGRRHTPEGGSLARKGMRVFVAGHAVSTLIRTSLHRDNGLYSARYPIAADQLFLTRAYAGGAQVEPLDESVGEFGLNGLSNRDTLGALTESLRVRVEVTGRFWTCWFVFVLRVLRNLPRLVQQTRNER